MMSSPVGVLSYNGYVFDGTAKVKVGATPVYDEAGRTVVCVKYQISVSAVVAASSTDSTLEEIRNRLTQPGQALRLTAKGFGEDLIVNVGRVRDVEWGPKPELLDWAPIGSANAAEITWRVTTSIPQCGNPLISSNFSGIMALNYTVDYSIDSHGDTTRTINGYLQIAQTRGAGKTVPDTADRYRERIAPEAPEGYKRTQNWSLSANRSRLNFSIVDTQIPDEQPWPAGVTEITARQRTRWSRRAGTQYVTNLTMEARRMRSLPGARLWAHFTTLVRQRMLAGLTGSQSVILQEIEVDENIFGLDAAFSATWTYFSTISQFITDGGHWRALGTDWRRWATSIEPAMFHPRGTSRLTANAGQDAIVDLCDPRGTTLGDSQTRYRQEIQQARGLKNVTPPPETSWTDYRMGLSVSRARPVARMSPLQEADADPTTPSMSQSAAPSWGAPGGTDDTLQVGGRSRYLVTLAGTAQRAGHKIPRPKLEQVGEQTPVEVGGTFNQIVAANLLGVPLYAASWSITYALRNSPGTVHPQDNLQYRVQGESGAAASPRDA